MIKRVKIEQLIPGMYVHDFNCGWSENPFLNNSFKVKDEKTLNKIVTHGIREVYIDTEKGLDVADAPTEDEVNQEIQEELNKVLKQDKGSYDVVPVEVELIKARGVKIEATELMHNLIEDVKMDRPLKVEKIEHVVNKVVDSILRNQDALMSLSRIRSADIYTYAHSISVCVQMVSFGKYLGYDSKILKEVGIGALLHDIGKTKIPSDTLNKKGKLSNLEYEMIKKHVEFSKRILEQSGSISDTSITTAYQHHERIDGTGYPNGLKGSEISEYGQAISIIDVYDAITSDRCYKKRIEPTQALKKLFEWSKYHFNGDLVQKFIRCVGIYPVGTLVLMESGWIGVVIKQGEKNLLRPVIRLIYNKKTENYLRTPRDVDLSETLDSHGEDNIIDYESADKWNLQPEMYL